MFLRSVARYQDAAPPQYKLHKEGEGEKETGWAGRGRLEDQHGGGRWHH